jgi:RAD51-like protein 2
MSSFRDVNSLPLARSHIDKLIKQGFRFLSDLENISAVELSKECDFSMETAVSVVEVAKESSSSINSDHQNDTANTQVNRNLQCQIMSAKDLISKSNKLRPIITFCKEIDKMLGGGVALGQITEFCGVPGVSYAFLLSTS